MSGWDDLEHKPEAPVESEVAEKLEKLAEVAKEFMLDGTLVGEGEVEEMTKRLVEGLPGKVDILEAARTQVALLKETEKTAVADIVRVFDAVAGTEGAGLDGHVDLPDGRRVMLTRSERWKWDQEVLNRIIGDDPEEDLPDYVKRSTTINRKKFESLPDDEQDKWKPALTREAAPAKIEVKR